MGPRYIGSIDQGTSSSRFILFDKHGGVVAYHQEEFRQIYPQPGWVEHDPMDIMASVNNCIEQTLAKAGVDARDVAAVGITNQRETTVVWDKTTGKPLHNAIVWLDTRTRGVVDGMIKKHGSVDHFRKICGLPLSTYFSAMKLKWLLENVPAVTKAAKEGRAAFGTIDSWIIWNLTGTAAESVDASRGFYQTEGVHATDVTNASRTMLMNLRTCQWDEQTSKSMGIPNTLLPKIRSSSEVYGAVRGGPLEGVKISGVVGDQQGALCGQLCFESGTAKNTYGTGCFMLLNTGTKPVQSKHGLLTTVAYKMGDSPAHYALEGSVGIAGSGVKWLRDNLGMIKNASEITELAGSVENTGGVYFVPAFAGLLSPYWRDDARGIVTGLTHYTTKAHFARAVLESSAYQSAEVLEAMTQDSGIPLKYLKVDGGLTNSDLLLQFQADLMGIQVERPSMLESTAAGAAFCAGLADGVKFWQSEKDLKSHIASGTNRFTIFEPNMEPDEVKRLFMGWKRAVRRTFNLAGDASPADLDDSTSLLNRTGPNSKL